jgi:hypothetical protein
MIWDPKFFLKIPSLRVILCGGSIVSILEARKCFPDSDSGNKVRKMTIFASETQFFLELRSWQHFQGMRMFAIDSQHKITPREVILEEKKFSSTKKISGIM